MPDRRSTLALIPACEEAPFIADVVRRTRLHVDHVIVVDDGSRDATAVEAATAGAEVIRHEENLGKGEAIKTGMRAAQQRGYSHILVLDGDGQHLPEEIPAFFEAALQTGAGLVIGNRMHQDRSMPWLRRMVNRHVSREICELCECRIPDTQCGFRLFRKELVPLLLCEATRFDYETEVLIVLAWGGERIVSVPVTARYGVERSKINPFRDTLRYWSLMSRYRRWRRDWAMPREQATVLGVER